MECAPLPPFPVSVQNTFLHYQSMTPAQTRSRSAPAEPAVNPPTCPVVVQEGRRLPQKATRELLQALTIEELGSVARMYGLCKLRCSQDQRVAERILPVPQRMEPGKLRSVGRFLEGLSWDQFILLLRHLARRRMGTSHTNEGAEYFEWVCNILLTSQLRDAALCEPSLGDGDSVMAWRMSWICAKHGLAAWWQDVELRLGCGGMVFLKCRAAPHLSDEIRRITKLVPQCNVASIESNRDLLMHLVRQCDVLYVGGKHDKSLTCLRQLDAAHLTLIVLNVCSSEKLARQLVAKGVRRVAYWPSDVHDPEAVKFGIAFVRNLFEYCIEAAFREAKRYVCATERAPRLLSSTKATREKLQAIDVVLEHRPTRPHSKVKCKPRHAGEHARVLPHTVMNGWVQVNVGELTVPWRVGHWREVPRGNDETVKCASTKPIQVVQIDQEADLCAETQIDRERDAGECEATQIEVCDDTLLEEDSASDFEATQVDHCEETFLDEEFHDKLPDSSRKRKFDGMYASQA